MLKKQILFIFLLFMIFTITGCKNSIKKLEEFPEIVNKLENYKVTGKLYSVFPTGTKESLITVYYQKPNMYRVEIDNSTNGDKQIILKNNNDVYVLLPSVNKSFKLKSGWPINSSYPYLLESLAKDYVNDDNKIITKEDNTTTVEMKVKLYDNASISTEKVVFNNDSGLPQEVLLYDDNKNLTSRFVYMNIEQNIKMDQTLFNKDEVMTLAYETFNSIEHKREKTYPTYYPQDSNLNDEKTISEDNERTYIMTFTGTVNYTIIEQEVIKKEQERTSYLEGDIYILGDAVAILNDNMVTFIQGGMEYIVASKEVETNELIKMAYSLVVNQEK